MLYLGRFYMKQKEVCVKQKQQLSEEKKEEAETIGLYKTAYCI